MRRKKTTIDSFSLGRLISILIVFPCGVRRRKNKNKTNQSAAVKRINRSNDGWDFQRFPPAPSEDEGAGRSPDIFESLFC